MESPREVACALMGAQACTGVVPCDPHGPSHHIAIHRTEGTSLRLTIGAPVGGWVRPSCRRD